MTHGSCLCGAHRFELEGPFEYNHHCHCGFCRKQHGSAFVSLVGVARERLRHERGETIAYRSSPDFVRESCAVCGTALPQHIEGLPVFVPAGCLDDLDTHFDFHIFAASRAPWSEIPEGLPAFDAYPPGVATRAVASRENPDPPSGVRGSCLCTDVRWVIEGPALTARHCHCSRCRKARAAAQASNLVVPETNLRFTAGQDAVRSHKIPDARYFTQCFCERCGGKVPVVDASRQIAVVPLGALDDPPPVSPREHIWTADIPAWSGIHDTLPRRPGKPL